MDAISLQKLSYRLYIKGYKKCANLICSFIHFKYNSNLPPQTRIGEHTKLGHRGIGCVIHEKAEIGDYCLIAQNCTLAGKDGGAPRIGHYCYIGANSVVLGGG